MKESWKNQMENHQHFIQRRTSLKGQISISFPPSGSKNGKKGAPGEEVPNQEKPGGQQAWKSIQRGDSQSERTAARRGAWYF